MPAKTCRVRFQDSRGFWHEVELQASSMFEAAARGLAALKSHPCGEELTRDTILEVRQETTGRVDVGRLIRWLDSTPRDAADRLLRYQLKAMLTREAGPSARTRKERWH